MRWRSGGMTSPLLRSTVDRKGAPSQRLAQARGEIERVRRSTAGLHIRIDEPRPAVACLRAYADTEPRRVSWHLYTVNVEYRIGYADKGGAQAVVASRHHPIPQRVRRQA